VIVGKKLVRYSSTLNTLLLLTLVLDVGFKGGLSEVGVDEKVREIDLTLVL
jgi:hypothetical protein